MLKKEVGDYMDELYKRIRILREKSGMTQDELAKKVGYKSRSTINKIELGINDISQSKIVALAKALGTTPGYLLGWEEIKNSPTQTVDEQLIELFSKLTLENKNKIIELADMYLKAQEKETYAEDN